nr:uncharacterized protein LOC110364100 [Columba livia]
MQRDGSRPGLCSSAAVQKPHLKSPHCAASLEVPVLSHHCLTLLSFPTQMSSAATGPQSEQKEDILRNSPVLKTNNSLCYKSGELHGELARLWKRLSLKLGVQFWAPRYQKDVQVLEQAQRREKRLVRKRMRSQYSKCYKSQCTAALEEETSWPEDPGEQKGRLGRPGAALQGKLCGNSHGKSCRAECSGSTGQYRALVNDTRSIRHHSVQAQVAFVCDQKKSLPWPGVALHVERYLPKQGLAFSVSFRLLLLTRL